MANLYKKNFMVSLLCVSLAVDLQAPIENGAVAQTIAAPASDTLAVVTKLSEVEQTRLKEQIQELQKKLDQSGDQLKEAEAAIEERNKYIETDNHKDVSREQALSNTNQQLIAVKETLVKERSQDQQEDAMFKAQIKDLQNKLSAMQQEKASLEKDLDQLREKFDKSTADETALDKQNNELKENVRDLQEQINNMQAGLSQNNTVLNQFSVDQRFRDQSIQQAQSELANVKTEKAEALADVRRLQAQVDGLNQTIDSLRSEVQIAKLSGGANGQSGSSAYQELLRSKENELSNTRADLARVQEQLRGAQDALRNPDTAGRVSALLAENKSLTEKASQLAADFRNAQNQLAEKQPMSANNAAASEKINALEKELATAKADLSNAHQSLAAAGEKISHLEAEKARLMAEGKKKGKSKKSITQSVVVTSPHQAAVQTNQPSEISLPINLPITGDTTTEQTTQSPPLPEVAQVDRNPAAFSPSVIGDSQSWRPSGLDQEAFPTFQNSAQQNNVQQAADNVSVGKASSNSGSTTSSRDSSLSGDNEGNEGEDENEENELQSLDEEEENEEDNASENSDGSDGEIDEVAT